MSAPGLLYRRHHVRYVMYASGAAVFATFSVLNSLWHVFLFIYICYVCCGVNDQPVPRQSDATLTAGLKLNLSVCHALTSNCGVGWIGSASGSCSHVEYSMLQTRPIHRVLCFPIIHWARDSIYRELALGLPGSVHSLGRPPGTWFKAHAIICTSTPTPLSLYVAEILVRFFHNR